MIQSISLPQRFVKRTILIAVLCVTLLASGVAAASARGYRTNDTGLMPGMVVALSESSNAEEPRVERAALDKNQKVIGVTTVPGSELVTIGSAHDAVYVQTTGEAAVYVTDLNGDVKNGDLLAPSPVLGILMKADKNTAPVVGISLEDFQAAAAETKTLEANQGTRDVKIRKMRINLDHKAASNQQASMTDSSLERLGRSVVGRDVGEIQVVAALVIFLAVLVAEGGIIFGAVSSSITAVGRNPMAKKFIQREMVRVLAIALTVLVLGVGAIYLILWI